METQLFNNDETQTVEILTHTLPYREKIQIQHLGGPPIFLDGKTICGTITISSRMPLDINAPYFILIESKKMRLELRNTETESETGGGNVFIGYGSIY